MSSLPFGHSLLSTEQHEKFTAEEHQTWQNLAQSQTKLLQTRAVPEVLTGTERLKLDKAGIPLFSDLNKILEKETGFSVVPVKGLIPEDLFFRLLAERKFPSTGFMRRADQSEYLEEPDIFHDVFGHTPLLCDPHFADFMQEFGIKGLEALKCGMEKFAARLYWFTAEFGLMKTAAGLKIYGAGITSSQYETLYALESATPVRIKFNPYRIMKTQYHTNAVQKTYFVIKSFQQLFEALHHLKWQNVQDGCFFFPEIEQGILLNRDEKA